MPESNSNPSTLKSKWDKALVREHELAGEPDLLCDFGIYGQRAVGRQELDERAQTLQFVLHFDPQSRREAHQHWERLQLYAKNYDNFLDIDP